MKVFVTGATGFVGSAVVKELVNSGHEVIGLSRNEHADQIILQAGARPHRGDLNDLKSLRSGADAADGLIHTAFNHDFSRFKQSCEEDKQIIQAFGDVYAGTDRPMVITSAIGLLPSGRIVNETDMPVAGHNPRIASEEGIDIVAARGVKVSAVRLPHSTHGKGDYGFVPMLIDIARKKGVSVYEGEGKNVWAATHRLDAAILYRLALEKATAPGARYHAVAEEGIAFRNIAEAIGKGLNMPVKSLSKEEAAEHFGAFSRFAAMDTRASSQQTQHTLGWHPNGPQLLEDIESVYFND